MENQTKKCTKCLRELPLENFRWKNKAQGKKHSQCKDCQKAQEKIHYQESSERRQAVLSTAQQQKQINLEIVNKFKSISISFIYFISTFIFLHPFVLLLHIHYNILPIFCQ